MKKLLSLILLGTIFLTGCTVQNIDIPNNGIACTEEAKVCADGSAVVRTGPNCEFEACTSTDDKRTEIKTAIANCQIERIGQTHQNEVTAELKDGTTIETIQPNIDNIFDLVDASREKCGEVTMRTE